jgi:hypothetical protein
VLRPFSRRRSIFEASDSLAVSYELDTEDRRKLYFEPGFRPRRCFSKTHLGLMSTRHRRVQNRYLLNVCTSAPLTLTLAIHSTDTFHLKTHERLERAQNRGWENGPLQPDRQCMHERLGRLGPLTWKGRWSERYTRRKMENGLWVGDGVQMRVHVSCGPVFNRLRR